jgi:hypothetical protein
MTFKPPHVAAEHEIQSYRGTAPGLAGPLAALLAASTTGRRIEVEIFYDRAK